MRISRKSYFVQSAKCLTKKNRNMKTIKFNNEEFVYSSKSGGRNYFTIESKIKAVMMLSSLTGIEIGEGIGVGQGLVYKWHKQYTNGELKIKRAVAVASKRQHITKVNKSSSFLSSAILEIEGKIKTLKSSLETLKKVEKELNY